MSSITVWLLIGSLAGQGRSGAYTNPELTISVIAFVVALLLGGLICPIFCMAPKPKSLASLFAIVFVLFAILMTTPIGFPYREGVSPQRYWIFVIMLLNIIFIDTYCKTCFSI